MTALLHQELDEMAGQLLGHVIMGQPLSVCETRRLAAALQTASIRARAIEGANVVPWEYREPQTTYAARRDAIPRATPAVRAVAIERPGPGTGDAA